MTKLVTLRSAFILGASTVAGSMAGTVAEALAEGFAQPVPFDEQLVTAAVTLWFAERLDRFIAEEQVG